MAQGTDASPTTHLTGQEEISSYIGRITSSLLHVIDYPPELENTFLKITNMFNEKSGPFAIIEHEGRNTTDFYANCYNNVRMAICATWYNLQTFENLCRELEEWVEEVTKTHAINSQFQMNMSGSSQKLCFEYEHFMFHQRATVDRIAFFLSGFFSKGPAQDNILNVRKDVVRRYAHRPGHLKHRFAAAIDTGVSRHQDFLDSIHSSGVGRGQTERDILSHKSFIPFVNALVYINPPGKVSIVFQATVDGRTIAPENARAILHQRYNQVAEFTKDMLDTFFDA
jgi:hypothetical protein